MFFRIYLDLKFNLKLALAENELRVIVALPYSRSR